MTTTSEATTTPVTPTATTAPTTTIDCELCIVGAGYAALNGLNAAAKYLKPGERVVVIDKNHAWGGQWLHQYDFVRLHQPYRMFTAGDQKWRLSRAPWHLATRREVLDHLATVPAVSAGHLAIHPLFGHEYVGASVRSGRVEALARPVTGPGTGAPAAPVRVRARRLLKATGVDIQMLPPFAVSSSRVRSVGVSDPVLETPEFRESDAPVYIIGGGKTAMDCARHLIQQGAVKRRAINVIAGRGMWFFHRENLYPLGLGRHLRGATVGDLFTHMSELFDGTNESAVLEDFARRGWVHNVFGEADNCRYGLLSDHERTEIRAGVDQVFRGHLVDVDGTRMVLREGAVTREVPVPAGAWFINCTTHLRQFPHEALIQESGLVCAPQYALGFTGTSAYFLTHLWYRDALAPVAPELFRVRLDVDPPLRFAPQFGLMVMVNMGVILRRLPFGIFQRFEGDYGKWYPAHRQIPTLVRLTANRAWMQRKAERLLPLRFADTPESSV